MVVRGGKSVWRGRTLEFQLNNYGCDAGALKRRNERALLTIKNKKRSSDRNEGERGATRKRQKKAKYERS